MSEQVTERSENILRVQLNRPATKNAMTSAMYITLAELFDIAAKDDEIRVVLWHGAGDSFCAGNDIADFLKNPPGKGESPQALLIEALINFDKPIVAAVHGAAIGGGTTMLTHCDFVYAGESAKFQMPFVNLALVPEFGSSYSVPARTGYLRAAELILTGASFNAGRASELGLVTAVSTASRTINERTKSMETKRYSERLTPENAALLLIDHQVGLFTGVRDIPVAELKHNVVALAKAVKVLGVPIIVTATSPEMWGPIIPELTEALPGISIINRTTVNAFDEPRFAKAVEATGRKKLIIAGVSTEVCLAFPAIQATGMGYDVYGVIDASGTFSETKRITGLMRMVQAGVIVVDYATVAVEILKDNASPKAGPLYGALDMPFAVLVGQFAGAFAKR